MQALGELSDDRREAWGSWLDTYRERLRAEGRGDAERRAGQDAVNPCYVARNQIMQAAIKDAEAGNYEEVRTAPGTCGEPGSPCCDWTSCAAVQSVLLCHECTVTKLYTEPWCFGTHFSLCAKAVPACGLCYWLFSAPKSRLILFWRAVEPIPPCLSHAGEKPDARAGAAIRGAARGKEVQSHGSQVCAHGCGAPQL